MSTKAKPIITKQESLYEKAKDVINDFLDATKVNTEDVKEETKNKPEGLKRKATAKPSATTKKQAK